MSNAGRVEGNTLMIRTIKTGGGKEYCHRFFKTAGTDRDICFAGLERKHKREFAVRHVASEVAHHYLCTASYLARIMNTSLTPSGVAETSNG